MNWTFYLNFNIIAANNQFYNWYTHMYGIPFFKTVLGCYLRSLLKIEIYLMKLHVQRLLDENCHIVHSHQQTPF